MLLSLIISAALAIQSLVAGGISLLSDFVGEAKWWDSWQAFGTVGATIVALSLGLAGSIKGRKATAALKAERAERFKAERLATASLVSAWIESGYRHTNDGRGYTRQDTLFVANESNEPVFDVHLLVGTGTPPVQVGPLAAPETIPVLPARSKRSWDISLGMLAHLSAYQFPSSVFGIFAALAEYEGELISERTIAGLASARARGRNGGRPYKMTPAKLRLAMAAMNQPGTKVGELCKELSITRQTLYRHVSPTGEIRPDGQKLLQSKYAPNGVIRS